MKIDIRGLEAFLWIAEFGSILPSGLAAVKLSGPKITRKIGIEQRRGESTSELTGVFQGILKAHVAKLAT